MKKSLIRSFSILVVLIMFISVTNIRGNNDYLEKICYAKSTEKLSSSNIELKVGKSKQIQLNNNKNKVTWSVISGKKYIALKNKTKNKVTIVALKSGSAKVQAKSGKKKYVCKVTVKKSYTSNDETNKSDRSKLFALVNDLVSKGADSKILNIDNPVMYKFDNFGNLTRISWESYLGRLKTLKVRGFKNLNYIEFGFNDITSCDLTGNDNLNDIVCSKNNLKELRVNGLKNLITLDCHNNAIEELNLQGNIKLTTLDCCENKLKELNLKDNVLLWKLRCNYNNIKSLDLSNRSELYHLECNNNNIEYLNIYGNENLQDIDCSENKITSLKLDGDGVLETLKCNNNALTHLDISGASNLEYLNCSKNKLTKIDFSNNKELDYLYYDLGVQLENLVEKCNTYSKI